MNPSLFEKPPIYKTLLVLYALRSGLFYLGYSLSAVLFAPITLLSFPVSFQKRAWFINRWSWFVLWWLKITCKITVQLQCNYDFKNGPNAIVLSNHQSTWEALYLQLLFAPATTVVKKELLSIPFFGWGLRLLEPISIDRHKLRIAGKHFMLQGQAALEQNRWVVLFPEGTRVKIGEQVPLNLGGFRLATASARHIIPVKHNAGLYWPARSFIKYPGCIQCFIGEPINSDAQPQHLVDLYQTQMNLIKL